MPGEAQSVWKLVSYWELMCACVRECVRVCVLFTGEVEAPMVPELLVRLCTFWSVWQPNTCVCIDGRTFCKLSPTAFIQLKLLP